jgi:serine/threonine protein kinase/tetratricopeptide (TPR) repeat protein
MVSSKPSEQSLFLAALEQPTPRERAAYVRGACGEDQALRAAVEALLAAHERSENLLDAPPIPAGAPGLTASYQPIAEVVGTVIGPYKLLQQIGEGGFGVVYMAEQERPVLRNVALKIIKPGMDTREVIARFESERQALAMMDHPNIARVLDAGATEGGRPYFVMELVKGVRITDFCDQNHMTAQQRLEMFVSVCHAVQHAHHKGIIHRDLKPSNVMVTLHDGVPVVKVIDFGVAKATAQKLTERTLFTAYGQMVGTPAYMSPEQAEMSGLDIDTRSDIYSLGVLLYELLTGTTPLDAKRLRQAGYAEMQRLIRDEEAPRPSTRLSSLGGQATTLANNRGTDPKRLAQLLRSDLDWIVMKALEKDRNRRYGSPSNFAADVERYLRHDPIEARPPSATYKLRKLCQRNRAAVITAAVVAAALVVGTVISTWQAVRATQAQAEALRERDEKEQARQAEVTQRQEAESQTYRATKAEIEAKKQAAIAEQIRLFLEDDLLGLASPYEQKQSEMKPDPDIKVRTVLDRAARAIEGKFRDQPLVEASIRSTIGWLYKELNQLPAAQIHLERSLELYRRERGPEDVQTLKTLDRLVMVYLVHNQSAQAERICRAGLATARREFGDDRGITKRLIIRLSFCCEVQGEIYRRQHKTDQAEKLFIESLEIRQKVYGEANAYTLRARWNLATVYLEQRKYSEAEALLREGLRILEGVKDRPSFPQSPDHFGVAQSLLGGCQLGQKKYAEAEPLLLTGYDMIKAGEPAIAPLYRNVLPEALDLPEALERLVQLYDATGQKDKAAKWRKELEATRAAAIPPAKP